MDTTNLEEVNLETEEKAGKGIFKRVLFVIFVVIPLVVFVVFYMRNATVKKKTNNLLSRLPGAAGDYFKGAPTESEKSMRIDYLADHFLALEPDVAADKIYIIKKDDEKLYVDIIQAMNRISPEKTESVILKVRNIEMRKDLLSSIYDEAKEEEESLLRSEASRIEGQSNLVNKLELERRFSSKEFQKILDNVAVPRMAEILYYTDPDIRSYIINTFNNKKRLDVEFEIGKIANEKETLKDLAKYYETKNPNEALEVLGNTDTYSIDKLASIFSNMAVSKSSRILSEMGDKEFIEELFVAIKVEEELMAAKSGLVKDISKSIEFFEEYNEKKNHLIKVYGEMSPDHVAKIVEKMVANEETVTIFDLDAEETFELSDRIIIIDILSGMKRDSLAKVMDSMKEDKASLVTQLLAKPEEKIFKGGENIDTDEQVDGGEGQE